MEQEPWEALDIDDSDLSTFLRPCKRRSNPSGVSRPLIPGPAGAVQAAMIHRSSTGDGPLLPTQEFVRHVLHNGHDTDPDFHFNAWLSALQFVNSATPLGSIKRHLNAGRVDHVVVVVKSCNPNGFGDATVTLKVFLSSSFCNQDIVFSCFFLMIASI